APGAGDLSSVGLRGSGHPLLGAVTELGGGQGLVLTGRLSPQVHPWLADHVVAGMILLPGAAFVELAVAAGSRCGAGRLEELAVEAPLVIPEDGAMRVQVLAGVADQEGRRPVEVFARPDGETGGPWTRYAAGTLVPGDPVPAAPVETAGLAAWPPPGAEPVDISGLYESLAAGGYGYGPSFRGLRAAWRRGDEVFAEVALPGDPADAAEYRMHPALLDAVLHAMLRVAGLASEDAEAELAGMMLPFAWSGVQVHAAGASALRARLTRAGTTLTVHAADRAGAPVITVESLVMRPVNDRQLSAGPGPDALFAVNWVPLPPAAVRSSAAAGPSAVSLAVIRDDGGEGDDAPGAGGDEAPGTAETAEYANLAALAAELEAGGPGPDAVLVSGSLVSESLVSGGRASDPSAATGRVLALVQEFLATSALDDARLVVVTQGAAAVLPGETVADPASAAVLGLVRSAQSENPGRLVLVDLPAGPVGGDLVRPAGEDRAATVGGDLTRTASGDLARLVTEVLESGEPEAAVRDGAVYVRRLGRPPAGLVPPGDGEPWWLRPSGNGSLDGLAMTGRADAAAPLAEGQARVAVRAAGLNFRDVMIALGMYPGAAVLGSEIAGVVTETGPGVSGLAPGDRVLGLAAGGFGPVAVTDARTLAKIPPGWSFGQAAAVPVAFA
ncbi:MAG: polyketide synthase dehydratase domain-containing protein, partial [Nocardiopsaceae bacterium]|nr:polyketide synthase dehydratase domain-containing protein [Nocardiopsaceae bacterium]